jgi:hypothetical protein
MGTLNYIAYVISALLFVSVAFTIYIQYQRGAVEQEFKLRAEELSERIEALGNQSPGTVDYFDISVPSNCELRFTDNAVVVVIGSWSENFPVGIPVSGPTFTDQRLSLRLERSGNGVNVGAA